LPSRGRRRVPLLLGSAQATAGQKGHCSRAVAHTPSGRVPLYCRPHYPIIGVSVSPRSKTTLPERFPTGDD
ncbi:MAG: hypothetical protein KAY37_17440, partial [Phycisphaerae bacterium]|nr:hypothetical protein [Phycisphaerae bacterium]